MATINWWVALDENGWIRYSGGSAQIVKEWIEDAMDMEPRPKFKCVKGRLTIKGYTVNSPLPPESNTEE